MAAPFVSLALKSVDPVLNNYEKVWDPVKSKAQTMRERRGGGSKRQDDHDHEPTPEERGWVLKKRSEVHSDEEIVERVPRNQQMLPYRPSIDRRASSLDRGDYRGGRSDRQVGAYRHRDDASDSESSVPPRSRVSRSSRSKRSSSKSTSDSEDLGSSTEDERRVRDIKRRKWLTGGFAAVATIHAAAKIYSSLEARDKRQAQIIAGEISPEESRKTRNKGRWQDAAAVGVAALGIRGAMGEWHEVEDKAAEHKKYLQQREENRRKRSEKSKRMSEKSQGGSGTAYDEDGDRDSGSRRPRAIKEYGEDGDRDSGSHRPRAIKEYGEHDRHRSKSMSMSTYDGERDGRALEKARIGGVTTTSESDCNSLSGIR